MYSFHSTGNGKRTEAHDGVKGGRKYLQVHVHTHAHMHIQGRFVHEQGQPLMTITSIQENYITGCIQGECYSLGNKKSGNYTY